MKKIFIIFAIFLMATSAFCANVVIEAEKQQIKPESNKGLFTGDVTVSVGDVKVKSPRAELDLDSASKKPSLATFFDHPYAFQEKGNKKNELKANIIKVSLIKKTILASGNSQSIMMEDGMPLLTITADSQEYDTQSKVMQAHKGVIVTYKDATTYSDEAKAVIDKNADINYLELSGHVIMKERQNVVKGDKFTYEPKRDEYQISGNTTSDLTFEDGSKIFIQARYQQINKKARTMIAGGKVKIVYADYVATGPKAQLFPDKKTGKPNEVIFTGRSKITQNGSSVEADRIKLVMKPKAFYADGNVKTSLNSDSNSDMELMP